MTLKPHYNQNFVVEISFRENAMLYIQNGMKLVQCDRLPHSPVREYVGRWHPDNIWQELNISAGGFTAGYLSVSRPDIRARGCPL